MFKQFGTLQLHKLKDSQKYQNLFITQTLQFKKLMVYRQVKSWTYLSIAKILNNIKRKQLIVFYSIGETTHTNFQECLKMSENTSHYPTLFRLPKTKIRLIHLKTLQT